MPYVRGKQFELLALKEMSVHLAENTGIRPVIEPVRGRPDALVRCLNELSLFDVPITVIVNPSVGDLSGSDGGPRAVVGQMLECVHHAHLRIGVLIRAGLDVDEISRALDGTPLATLPIDLVHHDFVGSDGLPGILDGRSLHLVRDKAVARRYRPPLEGAGQIKFEDRFPSQRTNLDYVGVPASLFTDDNIYFKEDGFQGWGDYATIGAGYSEGGSSPRAVVLHLTYIDAQDKTIWIRHFCSDSNEDTSDTAGKFGEALAKLVDFCDGSELSNPALDAFRAYNDSGAYPGLGMVKKLSIQNHLYVASEALAQS